MSDAHLHNLTDAELAAWMRETLAQCQYARFEKNSKKLAEWLIKRDRAIDERDRRNPIIMEETQ